VASAATAVTGSATAGAVVRTAPVTAAATGRTAATASRADRAAVRVARAVRAAQGGQGGQGGGQAGQPQGGQSQQQGGQGAQGGGPQDDDEFGDGRGRRRGRYRDRRGRGTNRRDELPAPGEPQVADDDVLIRSRASSTSFDNYAFIRTSGYLPGPNDVYVSLAQVRKNGLRKGDHVTARCGSPRTASAARSSTRWSGWTPPTAWRPTPAAPPGVQQAHPAVPQDRLRLETDPGVLPPGSSTWFAPIGKGQRGLIVSPRRPVRR